MTKGPEVTAAATFCATLVDEWARAGVRHAVVCPGSRSTPMALALAADDRLAVQVVHDERSAAFLALGVGLATAAPAVVLTTSGTAAAELHPAVVEADLSCIPMIVCTADRPPELQDVGAPQTIDQLHLYGRSVRWFAAPEVPDDRRAATWRPLASRAVAEATGTRPGPVHLNLAFRDPLVGAPGELSQGRDAGTPWVAVRSGRPVATDDLGEVAALVNGRRGAVLAGGGSAADPAAVLALAERLRWPVLADPRATGVWSPAPTVVAHADGLVRVGTFAAELPEVVLRVGAPAASKVVNEWLADVPMVATVGAARWMDPAGQVVATLSECAVGALSELVDEAADPAWCARWVAADRAAGHALAEVLARHPEPTEPAVARDVVASLPVRASLVVSSSMPVRDVEWYAEPRHGLTVHSNRGANGIDGVVSTGVGVAVASTAPTAVLVGDVAFLHDSNALMGLAARNVDLTIVVVDNDGGGIFSFLPQGTQLPTDRFELLFATPHGVDLSTLAEAHGIGCRMLSAQSEVGPAVVAAAAEGGTHLLVVPTDRIANVAVHSELHTAVATAVAGVH